METTRRRTLLVAAAAVVVLAAGALAFFLAVENGEDQPSVEPIAQQDPVPVPPEEEEKPESETDDPPPPKEDEKQPEDEKPAPPKEEVEFSLELRMKAARHLKKTREWSKATAAFEEIVKRCRTSYEKKRFGVPALLEAGECLYRSNRFREAYDVYDRIVRDYLTLAPMSAADAAYYRYRAATALHHADRTKENQKRKKEERLRFWRDFPNHPRAVDLGYYLGVDAIHAGDALAAAGLVAKGAGEYRKAIDDFLRKVPPSSILHLKARARSGEALYKLGWYDEALGVFAKVLDRQDRMKTTDRQRLASREQAEAIAIYYGALCHEKQGDWKEVLEILANFERLGDDREAKLFAIPVTRKRSEAFAALGRTDEAIAEIGKIGDRKQAADLAHLGLLHEKKGELEEAEEALAAAVTKREEEIRTRRPHVIRDVAAADAELKSWRDALERVRAARKR